MDIAVLRADMANPIRQQVSQKEGLWDTLKRLGRSLRPTSTPLQTTARSKVDSFSKGTPYSKAAPDLLNKQIRGKAQNLRNQYDPQILAFLKEVSTKGINV